MRYRLIFFLLITLRMSAAAQVSLPAWQLKTPVFRKDTFSILKFGAEMNSGVQVTAAINKAIEACSKKGGGVVLIPAGMWISSPFMLKSNINLHLAAGATLIFSADFNDYKLLKTEWEGMPQIRNQSPLSAIGASNIAITGSGVIDGNGDAWRMVKKDKVNASKWKRLIESGGILSEDKKTWYPSQKSMYGAQFKNTGAISADKSEAFYDSVKDFLRPNMVFLSGCKNILLEGVTFQNSPAWCLHPMLCENLKVINIKVKNPAYAQNGDGIDVESCKNVRIEKSIFDVGDDALCMKSGRDEDGRRRNKPTENVIIRDCIVYASHGGFVIGSEMSGGVKNISVENCTFMGTDIGLRFKTTRGRGGVVENINVKNIFMKDIVGEAILFDMYYSAKDPIPQPGEKREQPAIEMKKFDETTPVFKNFFISDVFCDGAEKGIFIRGLPESNISNIKLENISIKSQIGIEMQEATSLSFKNIKLYPVNTDPCINIFNCSNTTFNGLKLMTAGELGVSIHGDRNTGLKFEKTDFTGIKEKLRLAPGVQPAVVDFR